MKKHLVLLLLPAVAILQFCSPSKKTSSTPTTPPVSTTAKTTFEADVKPLIISNCAPCHTTGNKKNLETFAANKETIDDIILRIQGKPGDKGFMPFKHDRLPDSVIQVFIKWRADGLLEK